MNGLQQLSGRMEDQKKRDYSKQEEQEEKIEKNVSEPKIQQSRTGDGRNNKIENGSGSAKNDRTRIYYNKMASNS